MSTFAASANQSMATSKRRPLALNLTIFVLWLPILAWGSGPFRMLPEPINASEFPEDIELCKAFLGNLNSFPAWPPMVCERKLSPKYPQFSRPKWRRWSKEEMLRRHGLMRQLWPKSHPVKLEDRSQLLEKEPNAVRIEEAEPVELLRRPANSA